MKLWAVEFGTFWLSDVAIGLPPANLSRPNVTFGEVSPTAGVALQRAMHLSDPEPIHRRFQTGRRCFSLRTADEIVAYGWATRGLESVGELERNFHLHDDEIYIWDCGTVPAWRGRGCYTALLNKMTRQLHQEGIPRIWIGASRQNQPSIQGIFRAGFRPVIDMTYRRLGAVTWLWFTEAPSANPAQIDAAYRILTSQNEKRLGRFAIGLYRDRI